MLPFEFWDQMARRFDCKIWPSAKHRLWVYYKGDLVAMETLLRQCVGVWVHYAFRCDSEYKHPIVVQFTPAFTETLTGRHRRAEINVKLEGIVNAANLPLLPSVAKLADWAKRVKEGDHADK